MTATPVYAACGDPILGMKPWYAGLVNGACEIENPSNDDELKNFITTIVGNVLSDLFVAVAYISIGFIIYSGFMYITSDGNPSKAAKAQKSLAGSIIGLIISVAATAIVNFVIEILVGTARSNVVGTPDVDVEVLVRNGFNTAYGIAALVAVGFIVYGGITFTMSKGDASKVNRARNMLLYSIVGLIVVVLAFTITTFVLNAL